MRAICLLGLLMMNVSLASEEKSFLLRNNKKMSISSEQKFQAGDEVHSGKSKLVLPLHSGVKLTLFKGSKIVLTHHQVTTANKKENIFIDIDLKKGKTFALIEKKEGQEVELKINTPGASFAANVSNFEVIVDKAKNSTVKVQQGLVLVSSPYIQSFAPEVVKAGEKLRFDMKKKAFVK